MLEEEPEATFSSDEEASGDSLASDNGSDDGSDHTPTTESEEEENGDFNLHQIKGKRREESEITPKTSESLTDILKKLVQQHSIEHTEEILQLCDALDDKISNKDTNSTSSFPNTTTATSSRQ